MGQSRTQKNKLLKTRLWAKCAVCFVCLEPLSLEEATLEHIHPRSLGGKSNIRNLTISHKKCNEVKGSYVCRLVWHDVMRGYKTLENQKLHHYGVWYSGNFTSKEMFKTIPHQRLDALFRQEFTSFYRSHFRTLLTGDKQLIELLKTLRRQPNLEFLKERVSSPKVRSQWKLIVGMLLIERYFQTKNAAHLKNGIILIEEFMFRKRASILNGPLSVMLKSCLELEADNREFEELTSHYVESLSLS